MHADTYMHALIGRACEFFSQHKIIPKRIKDSERNKTIG